MPTNACTRPRKLGSRTKPDVEFLSYLSDIYRQILRDFATTAVDTHQANPDTVATMLANVGYVPASPPNAKDVDPTLTDIQQKALAKLHIKPEDILSPLTKTQNQPSAQTDGRAAAYRLIADVTSDDPVKELGR